MNARSSKPAGGVRRPIMRLVAAVLVGLALLASTASSAFAHAHLLRATPADGSVLATAPAAMDLEFSEPVVSVDGSSRLFGSGSGPVVLAASVQDRAMTVMLPSALAEDVYAVSYRVVSADGHPISGAVAFRIGTGDAPVTSEGGPATPAATATDAVVALLTGLHYLGLLLFTGLILFHRLVPRPPRVAPDRPLRWSLSLAVTGSVLLVPASAVRVAGGTPSDVVRVPEWLGAVGWPPFAAAGLVGVAGLAARWASRRPDAVSRLALPLALAALAGPALVGHTQTTPPAWLMLTADLGHLLAASFWLGGVCALVLEVRRARGRPQPPDSTVLPTLARTLARFSGFALASVMLLTASGLAMGVLIVGGPEALLGTHYGRTLLLKLGIVCAVVAIAAWNRFALLPQATREPAGRRSWRLLTRTLRAEAALLIAVVAVTGVLTNLSPEVGRRPPGATAVPFAAESQGLTVTGTLTPGVAGSNEMVFTLRHGGERLSTDQVTVSARLPAQDLGPLQATPVLDPETGEYRAGLTLPAAGRWQVQISARVDPFTKPMALIELPLS